MRQIISSLFILIFLASYLDTALVLNLLGRQSQGGCLPGGGCCCAVGTKGNDVCPMKHDKPAPATGSRASCNIAMAGCHPVAMIVIPQIEKDFYQQWRDGSNGDCISSQQYFISANVSYSLIRSESLFHPPNA